MEPFELCRSRGPSGRCGRRGLLFIVLALWLRGSAGRCADWPGFRGDGSSFTRASRLPMAWSETNHVAWRVQTAGDGQSSPVIWRDVVYVTGAIGARKEQLVVQALSARTGREIWSFTATSSQPEADSEMHSLAAPTPVAGEDGVFALFESGDCLALSHEGKLRWRHSLAKSVGEVGGNHGLGGSPVLFERGLFVPLDQAGPACLLALDRSDGSILWRRARPNSVSWSTPLVVQETRQLILSGAGTVAAYDTETGAPRWEVAGLVKNTVPSPSFLDGLLVVGSGSKGSNRGFELAGTNAPAERWSARDATCGFASPLLCGNQAYFLGKAGVLSCLDARTGATLFEERMAEGAWASPIGTHDRIFVFGESGKTTVIAAGPVFRPLQTNELIFKRKVTGVAATDGLFVLRAGAELVCVGEPASPKAAGP